MGAAAGRAPAALGSPAHDAEDVCNVKKPGASRPSSNHPTQKEATQQARKTTARTKGETVIHGKDGRIRQKDTARGGNDPNPPRDKH